MAFDQTTRKRLSDFVNDARRVLEEEFTRQLQNDFGLDPVSGTVTPLENLRHLNDAQRESARILRDTLAHYCASQEADAETGLDRIVREQAFTVLNRLAALRMAEARGLLIESVANGYQAKGFQLYARLAGTGVGETGDAYRVYLFSVFDEQAKDLPGLFDRFSPQGRLFPREAALLQVLALINDTDIAPLWSEDETIGWIYQYFNSKEERKAMRDASQAPRNSRELAVRNQFFTPRYVVEFLVDNTLGRLWFNATGGQTGLRERCQYLLVKPDEAAEPATKLRDPRTLKLLDPACGSMHFGLYAFDLFSEIYSEAWDWEQQHGPGSLDISTQSSVHFKPLSQTYAGRDIFLQDVPRLIIEHNIHGVDIDPRAAQIASLALWLRAQRAWHDSGVKAKDRPLIGRGHVIAAIAPPAEAELRRQLAAELDHLDADLFEKTLQLLNRLPELGLLLRIECELPKLVRQVYVGGKGNDLFATQEQEAWQKAEFRLRVALNDFAQSANSTFQSRLFALDALEGLRLIDLTRLKFDVVVMNPPFGQAAEQVQKYQKAAFPNSYQDIFQCFVERALEITQNQGLVGVLSARTGFFMGDSEAWRTEVIWRNKLSVFADLGLGVLDDALVEAAAYVIQRGSSENGRITASRHLATRDKETSLLATIKSTSLQAQQHQDIFEVSQRIIERLPGAVFAYWAPAEFLERFKKEDSFKSQIGSVRQGVATADDFRFARLGWEVSSHSLGRGRRWQRFSKGGEYSPPYDDIHLLVDWGDDGEQIKAYVCQQYPYLNGNWSFVVKNSSLYFRPGATFTVRTASAFAAKVLPADCIFSHNAQCWFHESPDLLLLSIIYLSTRVAQCFLELAVGGGDIATAGSAARRYTTAVVESVPSTVINSIQREKFSAVARQLFRFRASEFIADETSCHFGQFRLFSGYQNLRSLANAANHAALRDIVDSLFASGEFDRAVVDALGIDHDEIDFIDNEVGLHPADYCGTATAQEVNRLYHLPMDRLMAEAIAKHGAKRWFTKKSYFVDRRIEIICHHLAISPRTIGDLLRDQNLELGLEEFTRSAVSQAFGIALGRWDIRFVLGEKRFRSSSDPFSPLPICPPGQLQSDKGLPATAEEVARLTSEGAEVYPINIPWSGVLVDDRHHRWDFEGCLHSAFEAIWKDRSGSIESEASEILGERSLRDYFRRPSGFFADHLSLYSKSRRKAPIYWPLSTSSGSYTLWVYYHRLTSQTIFTAINDFVEPKLNEVASEVGALREKGSARSRDDERLFEELQVLELELVELRNALLDIAQHYHPNLDDGVEINAAPLWPLFRHKPWQKVLKDTWAKLEKGDYDWAHLAMNYWPERVREKCRTDKSLAIAHGLKDLYIEPAANPRKTRAKRRAGGDE